MYPEKSCLNRTNEPSRQHQCLWKHCRYLPLHKDSRLKYYLPKTFPKQEWKGSADGIQQAASHQLLPSTFPTSGSSSTRHCVCWEIFSSSEDIVGISVPHTISRSRRPRIPNSLDPGKGSWAGTVCALPASCYTLVIPHSPVWEMCSQEKYVISHYCLTTQPMILPKISNSGKSSHSSRSTFISWGANILLRDTATFTCLTSLCSFPQLRPHSSICGPFQTMRAHEEIPNDSYCTDCVQHTLNIQKVMLDQLYIAMALI